MNDLNKRFETERLILREYTWDDFDDLSKVIGDKETMKFYPKPYDEAGVRRWIQWNLDNYKNYGFGLYALILKENGEFIGDCGLTMQKINGNIVPEIGYHVNKNYHRQGYATEASHCIRDYVFTNNLFEELYSYMNYDNIASYKTAMKNGMKQVDEYQDEHYEHLRVFKITKSDWLKIK